jgi:hypothetical protein
MGGYVTSSAKAGVSSGDWRASAFINNLLRQKGDTFAYGNPFRVRSFDEHSPQRPFTFGFSLTRAF